MANPQRENGYVAIANELLDALCRIQIPSANRRVFDVIIRKTYGYNRKEDQIAKSQIAKLTGLALRTVTYCIQDLEAKGMIKVGRFANENIHGTNLYSVNKNYDEWVVSNCSPHTKIKRNQAKKRKEQIKYAKKQEGVVSNLSLGGSEQPLQKGSEQLDTNNIHLTKDSMKSQASAISDLIAEGKTYRSDDDRWPALIGRMFMLRMVPRLEGDVAIFRDETWLVKVGNDWLPYGASIRDNLVWVSKP